MLEHVLLMQVERNTYADGYEPVRASLVVQREHVARWRSCCLIQLQQIGLCELRGVYDIKPSPQDYDPPTNCRFTLAANSGCEVEYITSNCLVFCKPPGKNGRFYDPCSASGSNCMANTVSFMFAGFEGEHIATDVLRFATEESALLMTSLNWQSLAMMPLQQAN